MENVVTIRNGGEKIHFITYLGSCYKLSKGNKDSVRHVWSKNGFKNAAGLIWLLEALGAEKDVIEKAFEAGKKEAEKGENQPEQSNKIKDAVDWDKIRELCDRKNICKLMK